MSQPRQRTADRIVDAAVQLIRQRGLTVGLDHISLEEAITTSGVSRATAYRHWPTKADFLRQVLLRVVRDAELEPESDADIAAIRDLVAAHREVLSSPEGRRTLVVESLRVATEGDFGRIAGSTAWRDHLALRATCAGLPPGELRDAVAAELAASERAFTDRRARVYARLPAVVGYRLVPWLDPETGFTLMAEATGALMSGLVGRAAIVPTRPPVLMRALGSSTESAWTTESYAVVATVLSYLEPDPDVVWDEHRVDAAIAGSFDLEDEARRLRTR
ncbi:TetR/AcrR family transcriptional regulator [uncultured Cellulomonas sp.]|uniref:TetR/AcrR family transcriptional regulator n=1 Tax=uncultured Cellulomonas sp. TaxID=189682 RepID=UPI0028E30C68|nr:TetR/AcrR family transcriptional regulator [uncultured Cellulomonas sp.]